jgi:carboxyl-terminal processing protease
MISLLAFGIIIGGTLNFYSPDSLQNEGNRSSSFFKTRSDHHKIIDVLRFVESHYVDDVDVDQLMDIAISSILDTLDPHSFYISKSELQDVNERTRGDFEGIGVEYVRMEDTIVVIRVTADGPAEQSGLESGDLILEADGTVLSAVDHTDSIKNLIKGPKGSQILLKIFDQSEQQTRDLSLERGSITYHSVEYSTSLSPEIGYIKLSHFNGNAYQEFMKALESLTRDNRLEKLIIDVRDNPGGYLSEVVKILSQLFEDKGKLLVYTENRTGVQKKFSSTGKSFFSVGDIAVLVNQNSASASEILAGAIQDWERGVVVGQRSYGKGLVQEQFELSDGSAIRLTTAKYLTPSGRMIQRPYDEGIYENTNQRRYLSGEFFSRDSIESLDSLSFTTQYGSPLISGKGIVPDIFVPLDSFSFSSCNLWASSHIQSFIYETLYKKEAQWPKTFDASFLVEEWRQHLLNKKEFPQHCEEEKVPFNEYYKKQLLYYFFMFSGQKDRANEALLQYDKSLEEVFEYWDTPLSFDESKSSNLN